MSYIACMSCLNVVLVNMHRFQCTAACWQQNPFSTLSSAHTWFHVPVKIAMLVYVSKALQDLMNPASDTGFWNKLVPILGQLIQVAILPAISAVHQSLMQDHHDSMLVVHT